jgi:hypothetical protein
VKVLERRAAHDEIESVAWQRQIGDVAFVESDVDARFLRVLARHAHEGAADIDADRAAVGELGELDSEITRAWRDFEHPVAWLYSRCKPARQRPESFHVLGGLSRVPGGDEELSKDIS